MKGDEQQFIKDFFDYYRTLRGYHERSLNSNGTWLATNPGPFYEYTNCELCKRNFTRPLLFIAGEIWDTSDFDWA